MAYTGISLPYEPYTSHGKKHHSFELTSLTSCYMELYRPSFAAPKMIHIDDLPDGLFIAAFTLDLQMIMPWTHLKLSFLQIKSSFFDNLSDDNVHYHSKLSLVQY